LWLTIPVWKKGLGLQKINEVRICYDFPWQKKHLTSLKTAYAKAPFFEEHLPFLEEIFSQEFETLLVLNLKIIRHLMEHLRVPAQIVLLSELGVNEKEPKLSLEICKKMGASEFVAQSSAKKYLDPHGFERAGIELKFFNPRPVVYPQLWGAFLPNLSAFDLLFHCGPKGHDILSRMPQPKGGECH